MVSNFIYLKQKRWLVFSFSMGVGYDACGCMSSTTYCAFASFRKCRCEGRYHDNLIIQFFIKTQHEHNNGNLNPKTAFDTLKDVN
jgi:hypothetical protein